MYTGDMKHVFFATLIIALALTTPAYISFVVCIVYLLVTGVSPLWLVILGVLLDSAYGHRFLFVEHLIPLYTTLAVIGYLAITAIGKRLSFIS